MIKRVLLLAILIFTFLDAFTCSCKFEKTTRVEALNNISLLFTGTIIDVKIEGRYKVATFTIDVHVKNTEDIDTIKIYTYPQSASCGLAFAVGQYWELWSSKYNDHFFANICGRSHIINPLSKPRYFYDLVLLSTFNGEKTWRFKNKKTGAIGELVNGLPEGNWSYYYPNGKIKSRGRYKSGSKDGVWEFFRDPRTWQIKRREYQKLIEKVGLDKVDGIGIRIIRKKLFILSSTYEFKLGVYDGNVYIYGENYKPIWKIQYKEGEKHGISTMWNSKGEVTSEAEYRNGRLINSKK